MDEEQRAELAQVREEQRVLRGQLERLERRVQRLAEPARAVVSPLIIEPEPAVVSSAHIPLETPPPMVAPEPGPPPLPSTPAAPAESIEVRFGAKWFVRLAIFMLVAALAFLANYLYQTIIPRLGPASKVGLLYLLAGGIAGLGVWLERRRDAQGNAGLLNYARVVLAGGLAGVYYVTYAAHHYEPLRVITSPLLARLLLLAWTAFMTWLADRRNSQTLAAFSILLAYYASAASDVAGFTLVANLGLTVAAVFLISRRRWTAFSFASLAATFGSYAFWRYGGLPGTAPAEIPPAGLWIEGGFLACFWALFTFAAFFDRQQTFQGRGRQAEFVSLNNGAFFGLVGLLVNADRPGEFWKWSLIFGATLLALAEIGRRLRRPLGPPTVDSYYFGGVSLVTLGLILYFSGWQLCLILAAESATVLAASGRRGSRPLFWAASAIALLSAAIALAQTTAGIHPREPWMRGTFCGALLLFNAWQCRWTRAERSKGGEAFYSSLGLAVWFALLEIQITNEVWRSPLLAGAALALTGLLFALRLPWAAGLAQLYLIAAHLHWVESYALAAPIFRPPIWNPVAVLAITVGLGTLWEWLRRRPQPLPLLAGVGIPFEGAAFLLLAIATPKYFDRPTQCTAFALGSAAALGLAWIATLPRQRWWSLALAILAMAALGSGLEYGAPASFGYLPGILLLAAAQQFGRRVGRARGVSSPAWEASMISLTALGGWIWWSSRHIHAGAAAFTVSAGWSLYSGALFALGIFARERVCRWWGLAVLGCTLAHIVLLDIWRLGNFERFVSFLAISLVLLAIGFFYNRYPSKIREWL